MKASIPWIIWTAAAFLEAKAEAAAYTFTLLTAPGYSATWGFGINNAGAVVFTAGANEASFLRNPSGTITQLQYAARNPTVALGINNLGTIVGDVWDPLTQSYIGFIRTDDGQFSNFTYPGAGGMQVNAINDSGMVLGQYSVSATDAGSFIRLPTGEFRSFRYMDDPSTSAYGINNHGQISGQSDSGSFLRNPDGAYIRIAVPGAAETRAYGLNNGGQVVGLYIDGSNGAHGFVRDRTGAFSPVDLPGARYAHPWAINDFGQIVGHTIIDDQTYGFIATPVAEPPGVEKRSNLAVLKEGGEGRIAVQVTGHPEPQVQWFYNGTAIPDRTNATLLLPGVTRALEGLYWLVASNTLGQATSAPIVAVVSNVDPARFPAWCWQAGGEAACALESTAVLGPNVSWQTVRQYPVGLTSAPYVETNPLQAPRFYRLRGDPNARFTTSGLACGWWYEHAVGSRHRIEYSALSTGWTNWVVLTDLVLPESPHLFLDQASVGEPARVYRTTPVP